MSRIFGAGSPAWSGRGRLAETGWWMLSLFHPSEDDAVDWQRGNYSLITRGGRVESDAGWGDAKKPTRMVAEGSVIVAASRTAGRGDRCGARRFSASGLSRGIRAARFPVPLAVTARPRMRVSRHLPDAHADRRRPEARSRSTTWSGRITSTFSISAAFFGCWRKVRGWTDIWRS